MSSITIWLCCVLLVICVSISGQNSCDPRTFSPDDYPSLLSDLEVVGSHSRLVNSTDEITFEGMILGQGKGATTIYVTAFTETEALGACRSLRCSEVAASDFRVWNQTETCEFRCPDGKKANRKCTFMIDLLKCKGDAMNLTECITTSFFRYASKVPESNYYSTFTGVNLVCRECGEP